MFNLYSTHLASVQYQSQFFPLLPHIPNEYDESKFIQCFVYKLWSLFHIELICYLSNNKNANVFYSSQFVDRLRFDFVIERGVFILPNLIMNVECAMEGENGSLMYNRNMYIMCITRTHTHTTVDCCLCTWF